MNALIVVTVPQGISDSDAACVCMCARDSGNALLEHVFRSCGCHRDMGRK